MEARNYLRDELEQKGIRRALVTNFYFAGYSGSPLVALDVASELQACGVETTIAACQISASMVDLAKSYNLVVADIYDRNFYEDYSKFDLIWAQHWTAYNLVLLGGRIKFRYLIISSLSPFAHMESIGPLTEVADLVVFNSEETKAAQMPAKSKSIRQTLVMPNSLPDKWYQGEIAAPKCLHRVLAVSNNDPGGLSSVFENLEQRGLSVSRVGTGYENTLVGREAIDNADAIITIGHTVQKSIARGRPVYIYDRFGGPGWLHTGNFKKALHYNFSGRPYGERSTTEIVAEIMSKYELALSQSASLREKAKELFSLPQNISFALSYLPTNPTYKSVDRDTYKHELFSAQLASNLHERRSIFREISNLESVAVYKLSYEIIEHDRDNFDQYVEIFFPRHKSETTILTDIEKMSIFGAFIARQEYSKAQLFLLFENNIRINAKMDLDSPGIEKLKPNDPRYALARFEVSLHPKVAVGAAVLAVDLGDRGQIEIGRIEFDRTVIKAATNNR